MSPPTPPADLATRAPSFSTLRAGTIVHRFYTATFDPIHFDRGREGRLNAPNGSYGVLYAARERRGAFAETFLREPGRTLIPEDLIARKAYVALRITTSVRLVNLMGAGLARLGATAEVVHRGAPYDVPQAWSQALHDHPSKCDGIAYRARHDDEALCFALFDHVRVREEVRKIDLDRDWFWKLADLYGVGLAPPPLTPLPIADRARPPARRRGR